MTEPPSSRWNEAGRSHNRRRLDSHPRSGRAARSAAQAVWGAAPRGWPRGRKADFAELRFRISAVVRSVRKRDDAGREHDDGSARQARTRAAACRRRRRVRPCPRPHRRRGPRHGWPDQTGPEANREPAGDVVRARGTASGAQVRTPDGTCAGAHRRAPVAVRRLTPGKGLGRTGPRSPCKGPRRGTTGVPN